MTCTPDKSKSEPSLHSEPSREGPSSTPDTDQLQHLGSQQPTPRGLSLGSSSSRNMDNAGNPLDLASVCVLFAENGNRAEASVYDRSEKVPTSFACKEFPILMKVLVGMNVEDACSVLEACKTAVGRLSKIPNFTVMTDDELQDWDHETPPSFKDGHEVPNVFPTKD